VSFVEVEEGLDIVAKVGEVFRRQRLRHRVAFEPHNETSHLGALLDLVHGDAQDRALVVVAAVVAKLVA
jgi:hypothetical protein